MLSMFSGSLGVGHEEPLVGPRSVPLQQDGPEDLQLGHEWVSWGLSRERPVEWRDLPSKCGDEGGETYKMH